MHGDCSSCGTELCSQLACLSTRVRTTAGYTCSTHLQTRWQHIRESSPPCCRAGDGYVVIGSEDGQVRMFSETDKALSRAKTSIPGLGAPITSVDVTYDGKWVVATTKSYLMVIKTSYRVS